MLFYVFPVIYQVYIIRFVILPRNICDEAADAISAFVNSYSQLYTLKRTPSFAPYFFLTAVITYLIAYSDAGIRSEKFLQGISDLTEMSGSHGFTSRA